MCCIFTCCGWIIDLIQRVWTFTMSCCIMSAVGCVMVTTSMSGIALGYNYSLAEYIDLKETNVSVYLKRGVFDDEVADDMEWRRAGHLPVKGHLNEDNLRTGAPADYDESTTIRSGRRLDDSMVEGDDQNKFEGSLMRLTAKPVFQDTPAPRVTDDLEMASSITRHPEGSLDQLKAIQSLIDSRRAMGATAESTITPLATYAPPDAYLPYLPSNNNPNLPIAQQSPYRRIMAPAGIQAGRDPDPPPMNPARFAVPDPGSLQSKFDWAAPKYPARFMDPSREADFFISSPTYPTPITVFSGVIRPDERSSKYPDIAGALQFSVNTEGYRNVLTTAATSEAVEQQQDKQPDLYSERNSGDLRSKIEDMNMPPKSGGKPTEEEYEDEIKGLPVRRRRSIRNPPDINIIHPVSKIRARKDTTLGTIQNNFRINIQTTSDGIDRNNENNFTTDTNQSMFKEIDVSQIPVKISNEEITNRQTDINKKLKSDEENKVKINRKLDLNGNKNSLFNRLIALVQTKEANLEAERTTNANPVTAKKLRIIKRRKSFESNIVSSKYEPNRVAKTLGGKQPLSNQEILNSISVSLNEAPELLRNPASSTFVKFLQSTLTA